MRDVRRKASAFAAVGAGLALCVGALNPVLAAGGNPDKPGYFTCSASALRVEFKGPLSSVPPFEPFAANADGGHCEDANSALIATPAGPATITVLEATTDAEQRGASSAAQALHVTLGPLEVTVLSAFASAECQDNSQGHPTARRPILDGGSEIASVKVNGEEQVPDEVNSPQTIEIPGLGSVTLEEEETTSSQGRDKGGSITERALHVRTDLGDLVVAEAKAGYVGQPCAPGQTRKN
jgi:hypothetical protein